MEKVKDAGLASHVKVPIMPDLVLYQQSLNKDNDPVSPFLREQDLPHSMAVIQEENPKVIHSPFHDEVYKRIEEKAKNKEQSPLKYSYNLDSLKTMRQ